RLPERLRAPLVLCCLEGLARDEAASQLGLPLGTLKSRLERGRQLLRARLICRGLTLPAALAAVLVGESLSQAALPAALCRATLQAARTAAEHAAAGPSVPGLTAFARGGVRAKIGVLLLLAAGLMAAGASRLLHLAAPPQPPEAAAPAANAAPRPNVG